MTSTHTIIPSPVVIPINVVTLNPTIVILNSIQDPSESGVCEPSIQALV